MTDRRDRRLPNVPLPTLGGKQFWADVLHFHQWRIQRHVYTGHCRLIDARNVRRAWGSFDHCRALLDEIVRRDRLPRMCGPGVVVLHGLVRTRSAMRSLCRYLRDVGGYQVFNVSYPSTRAEVGWHAQNLASILANLQEVAPIHFVAHSLGNLVIRHCLRDAAHATDMPSVTDRLGRMVMLGPPNQGALLARRLIKLPILSMIFGPAGRQLAREWNDLAPRLAVPPCEFGILAGGRGHQAGWNPLLRGDDDLVVSVDETRLEGARDFVVLPVAHTFMMKNPGVQEATLRFLRTGTFRGDPRGECRRE